MTNTALVLVDIQNDYFPGGQMELQGSDAASLQARVLLDYFRASKGMIVHVQHLAARAGATFFLPGTEGAQIQRNVMPLPGERVVQKHFPNSFRETDLLAKLQENQIGRLVICGMMTHMCIDTTVRAANDLGFANLIAGDACATRDLSFDGKTVPADAVHTTFLAALNGSFGRVMQTQAVIAELK